MPSKSVLMKGGVQLKVDHCPVQGGLCVLQLNVEAAPIVMICSAESVEAHVFARTPQPPWWPQGWEWSPRALEVARRADMDAFFIDMRDWRADAEVSICSVHLCFSL